MGKETNGKEMSDQANIDDPNGDAANGDQTNGGQTNGDQTNGDQASGQPAGGDASQDAGMMRVRTIDQQLTHVWMVRTFLKHCDEAEDDEDLREVVRDLYDFILAVGPIDEVVDPSVYLKMAKKKRKRLVGATELYEAIQPEVSGHTNFVMAARSLRQAVDVIVAQLS